MKFYIETIGCKVNLYESNYIKETLINEGFLECDNISEADVMILNTCSVTNTSDSKCLKMCRKMKRENNKAIFVVCGCSTQNNKELYNDLMIDILLGTKNKSKIVDLINDFIKSKSKYNMIEDLTSDFENMDISSFNQVRAYIKIQDGCENYCSYCIIPYVRGPVRFKEYSDVIKEAKSLAMNGYKEIVLTGIHTGSYTNLITLIEELSRIKGIKRIRLSSIEITELKSDFMNLLRSNKVLCDNLHIPLQSGSNEILKRMNRKYDLDYYKSVIDEIRSIREDIYISTDVIVGHPYETEDLFNETYEFCKSIEFSKIHVFPYSDRTGTLASKMDNHVNDIDKKSRSKRLLGLSNSLEVKYRDKFINRDLAVLIEEKKGDYYIGHTSNFLRVKTNFGDVNEFITVNITKDNCN